jgi:hypothetical protein
MVTELIDAMPEARRRGDPFVTYRDPPEPQRRPAANPVVARIFLLTDGRCGSSCLDFADLLFAMGEVRHVGMPTHADTNYGDVRGVALPSGILRLTFAMKAIRGRPRRSGQPYIPSERWSGDMSDTAGIEALVLELAGR